MSSMERALAGRLERNCSAEQRLTHQREQAELFRWSPAGTVLPEP
jgi:hypothetical protein